MIHEITKPKIDKIKSQVVCPVELALRVLGGKWRGSILYQLRGEELRFNHLKMRVQDAVVIDPDGENFLSNKVLSFHLSELIEFGLVEKVNGGEIAYYRLSPKGNSAIPILLDLFDWGQNNF